MAQLQGSRWMALGAAAGLAAGAGWLVWRAAPTPSRTVYTAEGYGGYQAPPAPSAPAQEPAPGLADPVKPALDAYNAGRYPEAEQAAAQVVKATAGARDAAVRKKRARARWVLAFAAARRKELKLARARFAALRAEASQLPDKGKPEAKVGENPPTLEEEGAYQHAVLTGVLGDRKAAEAEYLAFMRSYPESPLVHAAVKRIGRLHGGDVPPAATTVWQAAMRTAQARDRRREREQSLCGPEVLAEVLRRRAEADSGASSPPTVAELAREMGADERGVSLLALAQAARKRGLRPEGMQLTWAGLMQQVHPGGTVGSRPVVAQVQPGHFVLVEQANPTGVRVWDPSAGGVNRPRAREYDPETWQRVWKGIALAL